MVPWYGHQEKDTVWRTADTRDGRRALRVGKGMHRTSLSLPIPIQVVGN